MVTFLQPWALVAAGIAAAGVVALHFIARRRPNVVLLPTARFVPEQSVRAPSRSTRPADLLLLSLRVLAVLLLGAAFAHPVLEAARRPLARVVALDLSGSAAATSGARDSARLYLREGDQLVLFDSAARLVAGDPRDSLEALAVSKARGSLSAALVGATRAAAILEGRADSVELVVISPFAAEEWDAATRAIRALWPGRARLVAVPAADDSATVVAANAPLEVVGSAVGDDDPVRVAVALAGGSSERARVRIVRGSPSRADSAWAGDSGHVLVEWPASPPVEWPRRDVTDTVGAVAAGSAVLVADFPRSYALPAVGTESHVIARWLDGSPAASEEPMADGCVRRVAVPFPERGDLALRESARRFVYALSVPCGGARDLAPPGEAELAALRGGGTGGNARLLARGDADASRVTPWLLGAAALLLVVELLVRRLTSGQSRERAT